MGFIHYFITYLTTLCENVVQVFDNSKIIFTWKKILAIPIVPIKALLDIFYGPQVYNLRLDSSNLKIWPWWFFTSKTFTIQVQLKYYVTFFCIQ
jgi:hypothetical protein